MLNANDFHTPKARNILYPKEDFTNTLLKTHIASFKNQTANNYLFELDRSEIERVFTSVDSLFLKNVMHFQK